MFGGQRVSRYFKCSLLKIIDSLSIVDKCLGRNLRLLRFFKSHLPNPFCNPTNNVRTGVSRILTPKFQRCIRCGERICEVFPKRWQYFRRTPKKLQVIMKSQCPPLPARNCLINHSTSFFHQKSRYTKPKKGSDFSAWWYHHTSGIPKDLERHGTLKCKTGR